MTHCRSSRQRTSFRYRRQGSVSSGAQAHVVSCYPFSQARIVGEVGDPAGNVQEKSRRHVRKRQHTNWDLS